MAMKDELRLSISALSSRPSFHPFHIPGLRRLGRVFVLRVLRFLVVSQTPTSTAKKKKNGYPKRCSSNPIHGQMHPKPSTPRPMERAQRKPAHHLLRIREPHRHTKQHHLLLLSPPPGLPPLELFLLPPSTPPPLLVLLLLVGMCCGIWTLPFSTGFTTSPPIAKLVACLSIV